MNIAVREALEADRAPKKTAIAKGSNEEPESPPLCHFHTTMSRFVHVCSHRFFQKHSFSQLRKGGQSERNLRVYQARSYGQLKLQQLGFF